MNRENLIHKLTKLGVPRSAYGLYDEVFSSTVVIYENYSKWEVFKIDEKGDRFDMKIFKSEDEACRYVYDIFVDAKALVKKYHMKWYGKDLE